MSRPFKTPKGEYENQSREHPLMIWAYNMHSDLSECLVQLAEILAKQYDISFTIDKSLPMKKFYFTMTLNGTTIHRIFILKGFNLPHFQISQKNSLLKSVADLIFRTTYNRQASGNIFRYRSRSSGNNHRMICRIELFFKQYMKTLTSNPE